MPDAASSIPRTSSSLLHADAPSLLSLHSACPDISVITPSHPEYTTVHQEYNCCNTTVPLAIIFPSDIDQLRGAVKHCTSQSPPIAMTVRGGGHDAYGRNALAGAVQLDLRLMKWTEISLRGAGSRHGNGTVTIGRGTTAIEMQRVLDAAGLAAPTGWVGTVGMTGWACGGGYGLETGTWGLGVDNIVGAKLVTPHGTLIDTDDDADLLWAVRGAGLGNFGVNFLFAWIVEGGEDIAAGWAYLEKLKALGTVLLNTVAESKMDFPFSLQVQYESPKEGPP